MEYPAIILTDTIGLSFVTLNISDVENNRTEMLTLKEKKLD